MSSNSFTSDKETIQQRIKEKNTVDFLKLFSDFVNGADIAKQIKEALVEDCIYIAKIPTKLQGDFKSGFLHFMTNKQTGESLGTIVNNKNRVQGFVNIEKHTPSVNISGNLISIAISQRLAQLADVLDEVRNRVATLQAIHDADLDGEIRGMLSQLKQCQLLSNYSHQKDNLLSGAINQINITRGKCVSEIEFYYSEMPDVPNSTVKLTGRILANKEYLPRVVDCYYNIERLVTHYLECTELLALAYSLLGEDIPDLIDNNPYILLSEVTHTSLVNTEQIFSESVGETWYNKPSLYFNKIGQYIEAHSSANNEDYCIIEISGTQLLEAMNHADL